MGSTPKLSQIGPYQISEELGRGAMGVVFRGFDPSIGRPVAIKVIKPQHGFSDEQAADARLRFSREASAAGRLSHPNIVTIYQMGEDRGYQYMAMEFVEGAPLNQLMEPGVAMKAATVLDIVRQIADALDHAHQQEVVHRDVKPPNILVRTDGRVKIADFGIARLASQTLTVQGTTLGTPAYMAPEQIRGSKVDGKADQFSLGVLAYQMLCGQRPFEAPTEQAMIFQIVANEPKPIREANPALPAACSTVLGRAMAKDPAGRYSTCMEFSRALDATFVTGPVQRAASKKSALGTFALAGIAVVLVGVLVSVLISRQSEPAPRTPPHVPALHEQLRPDQGRQQRIAALEIERQRLEGELDQAQKKVDVLRERHKDSFPDVQTALQAVNAARKALDAKTRELTDLKAAK